MRIFFLINIYQVDLTADKEDMKVNIGVIIFMSIKPMVQISQNWSTKESLYISSLLESRSDLEKYLNFFIFHFPQKKLSSRISDRRFREISKLFHISFSSKKVVF